MDNRNQHRRSQKKNREPKECVCDSCGMMFYVKEFDSAEETMRDGNAVKVLSFTCPKCDSRYIVQVMDERSKELRADLDQAKSEYKKAMGTDAEREAWQIVNSKKRSLVGYMHRLKKKYLKEMRRNDR